MELDKIVGNLIQIERIVDVPRRKGVILKHPNAPVTGNLKYNALKVLKIPDGVYIYVNEAIAPYMPFTNEPWVSPKWKGAKNPNEHWWEHMVESFADDLAEKLNGVLIKK